MFESRCGLCCSTCEGREEANCKGCVHMELPFWGEECPVKSCCEKKSLAHCGQCPDFPCATLADMGKEEGFDNTERIARCQKWAREETAETVSTMTALGVL